MPVGAGLDNLGGVKCDIRSGLQSASRIHAPCLNLHLQSAALGVIRAERQRGIPIVENTSDSTEALMRKLNRALHRRASQRIVSWTYRYLSGAAHAKARVLLGRIVSR